MYMHVNMKILTVEQRFHLPNNLACPLQTFLYRTSSFPFLKMFFMLFLSAAFPLKTSPLALWAVWYWRTMLRLTTRTSLPTWLTSSNENVSTTSETLHRSSELRSVGVCVRKRRWRKRKPVLAAFPSQCESDYYVGGWIFAGNVAMWERGLHF